MSQMILFSSLSPPAVCRRRRRRISSFFKFTLLSISSKEREMGRGRRKKMRGDRNLPLFFWFLSLLSLPTKERQEEERGQRNFSISSFHFSLLFLPLLSFLLILFSLCKKKMGRRRERRETASSSSSHLSFAEKEMGRETERRGRAREEFFFFLNLLAKHLKQN